jgi:hypothetical protein
MTLSLDPVPIRRSLDSLAEQCRRLADACFAASDAIIATRPKSFVASSHVVMDCWYTTSTTARILSNERVYDAPTLALSVSVLRRVAERCAEICDGGLGHASESLTACGTACRQCAAICAVVLDVIGGHAGTTDHAAIAR